MTRYVWLAMALVVGSIAPAMAGGKTSIVSRWRDRPIAIDGSQDDWGSSGLTPFGSEPVSIDVTNDADFLYVRLTASEPSVRNEILRRGLILWFDPEGGTKKRLGIEYPVAGEGGFGGGRDGGYGRRRSREGGSEGAAPGGSADQYEPPDRLEVHGPGKDDVRSLTMDHAGGIDAAVKVDQGSLVYELKVPLAKATDREYAIEASPGQTIAIGLETPKTQRPAESDRGGFGGGMGRGGGGMGRGGGMRRPRSGGMGGEYQPAKPLKGWATIALAKGV